MRKLRLLTITLVSFLLLCLTVICANASWFIQDKNRSDGASGIFNESNDTSDYFTTGPSTGGNYEFDAGQTDITPALNSDGVTILGGEPTDYTITWVGCTLTDGKTNYEKNNYTADLEGVVAGTHYYRIIEKATGQVISNKHAVAIEKRAVTVSKADAQVGFVGDTLTWGYNVYGVSSSGGTHSLSGNSSTFEYVRKLKISDYGTNGCTTSQSAYTATSSIPVANTSSATYTDNVASKYDLSGSMKYGNYWIEYSNNYYIPDTLTYSASYTVLPTTYTTENTTTFWATITEAIKNTESGTIYPLQQIKYDFGTTATADDKIYYVKVTDGATPNGSYVHEITETCTLAENVTLTIPFGTDVSKIQDLTYHIHSTDGNGQCTSSCDHRPSAYNNNKDTWYTNAVTLKTGKTLENNGTINVSGTISGGAGGYNQNSITAGLHARILMESSATIDCNGTINCWGFIDETSSNNGSEVTLNSGATLTAVFSVNEHRGGKAYMGSAVDEDDLSLLISAVQSGNRFTPTLSALPFTRIYIHSVISLVNINYGATVYGYVDLYANNLPNETHVMMVGNSSSSAFIRMVPGGKITNKFNPSTMVHDLDIYGTITMGALQLNMDVTYSGLSVKIGMSSSGIFFPLSYHWDVNLKKFPNGSAATPNLTAQYLKLLPGSALTIDDGVSVTASSIAVYENDALLNPDPAVVFAEKYNNSTPAKFTVNGSLTANKLGGTILTKGANATVYIIDANTVESYEIVSMTPAAISILGKSIEFQENILCSESDSLRTANGLIATSATTSTNQTISRAETYTSFNNSVWFKPKATITLNANTTDGSGTFGDDSTVTTGIVAVTQAGTTADAIKLLEKPGRPGYKFVDWYLDAACTISPTLTNIRFDNDTTLYAKWTEAATVTVTYSGTNTNTNYSNISFNTTIAIDDELTIWQEQTNSYNTAFSQYVESWTATWTFTLTDGTTKTSGTMTFTPGSEYRVADALTAAGITDVNTLSTNKGDHTVSLVANWANKHVITVTINPKTSTGTTTLAAYNAKIDGTPRTSGYKHYLAPGQTAFVELSGTGKSVWLLLGSVWCEAQLTIGSNTVTDTKNAPGATHSATITGVKDGSTTVKIGIGSIG